MTKKFESDDFAVARRIEADHRVQGFEDADSLGAVLDEYIRLLSKVTTPENPTVLEEANALVYGDRQGDYGHPRDNYLAIAGLFNAYIEALPEDRAQRGLLTAADAAMLMLLMKVGRFATGSLKRDTVVDICGYGAVVARILELDE